MALREPNRQSTQLTPGLFFKILHDRTYNIKCLKGEVRTSNSSRVKFTLEELLTKK